MYILVNVTTNFFWKKWKTYEYTSEEVQNIIVKNKKKAALRG